MYLNLPSADRDPHTQGVTEVTAALMNLTVGIASQFICVAARHSVYFRGQEARGRGAAWGRGRGPRTALRGFLSGSGKRPGREGCSGLFRTCSTRSYTLKGEILRCVNCICTKEGETNGVRAGARTSRLSDASSAALSRHRGCHHQQPQRTLRPRTGRWPSDAALPSRPLARPSVLNV